MKKSKTKEAKFFCESCGSEVPGRAKVCPVCGKFFASVRCPKCGRTGVSEDFKNGCPTCGYAVNPDDFYAGKYDYAFENINKKGKKNKNKSLASGKSSSNKYNNYYNGDSGLPVWVYVVTLVVLVGLIICLYSCL